jgi:crotonobetainyl-CoA:carnitine CoA-transferase CaiB-like acyl-CoA transferase
MGSAHPLNAPYQAFATTDGWITVGAANQTNWLRLLDVLDSPSLRADERFATGAGRMRHLPDLEAALNVEFRKRSSTEWLDLLERAGIPAGPVLDVIQMHANEQTRARAMVVETEHSTLGKVETIGLPVKFSATPGGIARGAPVYGQHTREVLREYGYADAEIDALARAGAVHLGEAKVAAE